MSRREVLDAIFPGDVPDYPSRPRRLALEDSDDAPPPVPGWERGAAGESSYDDARAAPPIAATPFLWRLPASIPPREWIFGRFLCRRYVSALVSPGGIGKSTLVAADAVAMATGRRLLADRPHQPLRVWLWNGEDPADETERRVAACVLRHDIDPAELDGRLFIDTGREMPIKIASSGRAGVSVAQPVVDALIATIDVNQIDAVIVDPFVSAHDVVENDNGAIDAAVKAFALVAHRTGAAILLVHHSRKLNGGEADIDAARGGSAIAAAVRSARVLNVMSSEAAKGFGIAESQRRSHVRIDDAKANLAPVGAASWFRLTGIDLENSTAERPSDMVAVAEHWSPPDPLSGLPGNAVDLVEEAVAGRGYRENAQAKDWVGHAIGAALGLDPKNETDCSRIKAALKIWIASGVLVRRVVREDGKDRPIIDVSDSSE